MKNITLILILMFSILYAEGQIINVNPDKSAEAWILGGLRVPSQEEIDKIPVLNFSDIKETKDLPSSLDNSTNSYFRPIFNQTDGSCAQASGVAYTFTYEINRLRETSANTNSNQFPTHYTYNFLNGGSGANGSWYNDGWEIIKANGCPTVSTYGSLAQDASYWMSSYTNYEAGMNNRVKDYFAINVSTPEGLETLKYWMYDHLDGSSVGSLVNFSAGISNTNYQTSGDKVISWGNSVNHAMTFVGWDDNIEHDYSGDGNITNDVDINNDGVVDMKDWEKGALIMVNSWGTYWMNGGKAYVMYKVLAEALEDGGIHANKVYGINVKESQEPQLLLKVKMEHNSRNKIQISAGVSGDVFAVEPEFILDFPLFNKQGGDNEMRGTTADPIEITLDVTPLLNHINSGEQAKYFLIINESDTYSESSGQVYDFSIVDNTATEYTCSNHNVSINNDDLTILSLTTAVVFETPEITTSVLSEAVMNESYEHQLTAEGGAEPYSWTVSINYSEEAISEGFPTITNQLTPNSDDDGYVIQTIGFDFPFYGELYNEFTVNTDGSLLFEEGFEYLRTEEAIMGTRMIAVFASDLMLYPADGDGIFYEGDANSATFRWKTSLFDNQAANIDVAVTLYPNGDMKFFYGSGITTGLSWASGISDGGGSYLIADISGANNPSNLAHKMSAGSFPYGMHVSSNGLFSGIAPDEINTWDIEFKLTDNNNLSGFKTLSFSTAYASVSEIEYEDVNIFPNPFKESVIISYSVKSNTPVKISVYDLTGKMIYNLVNETQSIGEYQVKWAPEVPSGLYIYSIETDSYTKSGKLIVQ